MIVSLQAAWGEGRKENTDMEEIFPGIDQAQPLRGLVKQ